MQSGEVGERKSQRLFARIFLLKRDMVMKKNVAGSIPHHAFSLSPRTKF
jgi:hypothetical protein